MAAATSPASGRRYGIARVCRIWETPRSSFYAAQRPAGTATPPNWRLWSPSQNGGKSGLDELRSG